MFLIGVALSLATLAADPQGGVIEPAIEATVDNPRGGNIPEVSVVQATSATDAKLPEVSVVQDIDAPDSKSPELSAVQDTTAPGDNMPEASAVQGADTPPIKDTEAMPAETPDAKDKKVGKSKTALGAVSAVKPAESKARSHTAQNIDLKQVTDGPETAVFPATSEDDSAAVSSESDTAGSEATPAPEVMLSAAANATSPNQMRQLLGMDIPPGTTTRVNWSPSRSFAGIAVDTPVLVVNGAMDGPTLCLIAAIHGDELNGIEMVRRVLYDLDPEKLRGMVVGVPIVNLLGFSRNSRYLPDRRDLNRYFPGNPTGSMASRLAHTFFNDVIMHCNALVDLHTGSFYRTNITQLRADLSVPEVADFTALFGDIPVLNTTGNRNSLRAAAVRAGIPTVTLEAGEPMRMQTEVVAEGVIAINNLLNKNGMYPNFGMWAKPAPAFYRSTWVRANTSGILFSAVKLGQNINKGDVLGSVINPVSNEKKPIISKHQGKVLGMALDQFVLPGFAAYHIGIRERDAKKLVEAQQTMDFEELNQHDSDSLDGVIMQDSNPANSPEEGFDD